MLACIGFLFGFKRNVFLAMWDPLLIFAYP